MKILVLNCGSSSIKYQLMDMSNQSNDVLAKGIIEKIGLKMGRLKQESLNQEDTVINMPIETHQIGIELLLDTLTNKKNGILADVTEIMAIGHRIVHGGEFFNESVLVTPEVKKQIKACFKLAPLHNPHNLNGILALEKVLPTTPQVAVFDTSFHQTIPSQAYLYGIPYSFYEKYKMRRYGFHGTSHRYVAQKACGILGVDIEKMKIITCHLGNGASITAIDKGKSVDTSMGYTPEEGLLMGTRCGDLGIGVFLAIMEKEELDIDGANAFINNKCGLKGISGVSSDMRDVKQAADEGNERAQLALGMYNYRVKKYIGAYIAAMGGVDLLLFTGGIGENSMATREGICKDMSFLGIDFDTEKNKKTQGIDGIISQSSSKINVMVITTNEELVIAQDTLKIVSAL
jgi:acetate kinase